MMPSSLNSTSVTCTNALGSRQLRAVAGMLLALSGLSLAAMVAGCSSPSTEGKSVSGLGELTQEKSTQEKSIQEKTIQQKFAAHRSVPAPLQPGNGALVARHAAPNCDVAGVKPNTVDGGLWARLKLDYERHCYKQADTSADDTRDKLGTAQGLNPSEATSTVSGAAVKDAASAPSVLEPKLTNSVATPSSPPLDAKSYRKRAIAAYHNGDLALALVDFDLAIRLDPNFAAAYINRGIILYRMREPDLAFNDVAQALRIENSHRTATPPLPKASPLKQELDTPHR